MYGGIPRGAEELKDKLQLEREGTEGREGE